jgi:methionine-rich copper-binding protein CopC
LFRFTARLGAAALLGLGLISLSATASQAHSQLVKSSPANGIVLATAPSQVVFTFDENLLPDLDTISINNEQGVNVTSKQVEPVANTLTMPWPVGTPAGTYQVAYRIVSGDGHPVTGAITFTIGSAGDASAQPTPLNTEESNSQAETDTPIAMIVSIAALVAAVLSIGLIVVLVKRGNSKS